MTGLWKCLSLLVAIATCMGNYLTTASPCDGSPEVLTVDYTPRRLFSPGYLSHYDNNLRCFWLFETITNKRAGFGIQLVTLELDLNTFWSEKCNDSLEIFEGAPSSLGLSLGKWCGKTKHIIKTLSEKVTLRFLTNEYYVGKGFVIEYSLVRVASAECRPGRVTPVHIGRTPLYESFDVTNAEERCTWTMEAIDEFGNSDPTSTLVIEAFSVPNVLCEVGHFIIYDGQDTSSLTVLQWCDYGQAFSKIYLSSNYATLTFFFKPGKKLTSKVEPILLKLYTWDPTYDCNDTYLPSINVDTDPVYFSLPLFKSPSGTMCSVHMSQNVKNSLRLDVMSVSGQETTCETEAVTVRTVYKNEEVKKLCNRKEYPMYLPEDHHLVVSSKNKSARVYIRALANNLYCGFKIQGQAYDEIIMEEGLPKDFKTISHNCHLRYVITTRHKNRSISLNLKWKATRYNVFSETDSCNGDFVNVYDGNNESAPLLFSTCRKSDMPDDYVNNRIIGTEEKMLILYNTDEANEPNRMILQFYAVPVNVQDCRHEHMISVNRSIQRITSPNYPDFFPMDYICLYVLTTTEGNVIVVEPEDTKFTSGCGDIINIYEGTSWHPDYVIGRICGQDKLGKKFVSSSNKAMLQFKSDTFGSSGGWKVKVYSRIKTSGENKEHVNLMLAALAFFLSSRIVLKL